MERLQAVRAAGAREWSDDVEATSALLSAAGVLDLAPAQRRILARSIIGRKFSPSDVLTFLVHHLQRGRGGGWLCVALRVDPEAVGKARCKRRGIGGAIEQTAGVVDRERVREVAQLVECVAARASVAVDHQLTVWREAGEAHPAATRDAIRERLVATVELADFGAALALGGTELEAATMRDRARLPGRQRHESFATALTDGVLLVTGERNERLRPGDAGTEIVDRRLLRRDLGGDGRGSTTEQPREETATGKHAPSLHLLRERFYSLLREGRSPKEASDAVVRLACAIWRPKMAPSTAGTRRQRLRLA